MFVVVCWGRHDCDIFRSLGLWVWNEEIRDTGADYTVVGGFWASFCASVRGGVVFRCAGIDSFVLESVQVFDVVKEANEPRARYEVVQCVLTAVRNTWCGLVFHVVHSASVSGVLHASVFAYHWVCAVRALLFVLRRGCVRVTPCYTTCDSRAGRSDAGNAVLLHVLRCTRDFASHTESRHDCVNQRVLNNRAHIREIPSPRVSDVSASYSYHTSVEKETRQIISKL